MGKIAGIRDRSFETYGEKSGQPTISTQSVVRAGPFTNVVTPFSLLPSGPIEAGGSGGRIIVMVSGQLQWPNTMETPAPSTCTVGIYLDGTLNYSIQAFVPIGGIPNVDLPQPVSFSLYWETATAGAHEVDVKVTPGVSTDIYAANVSVVLITTPV